MKVESCCLNLLSILLPLLDNEKKGTCIKIGVKNIKLYSEMFARLGFNDTVVVEPFPLDNLKQLCNDLKIKLIESCVSDINGIQNVYIVNSHGSKNLNLYSLHSDWWDIYTEKKQVASLTLPQLFININAKKITCLKIIE